MPKSPRNTAADHPLLHIIGAMDAQRRTGDPMAAIPEMEAAGQRQFVHSEVLPTKINGRYDFDVKGYLSDIGIKFGDIVDGDPLFQQVELPAGWKKEATDHSMWSKVVDDKGRTRLSIFYKAAFYDRDAFMNLESAITLALDRQDVSDGAEITAKVLKGLEIVFSTEPVIATGDVHSVYDVMDRERGKAIVWMEKNYPDYKNPTAYWD